MGRSILFAAASLVALSAPSRASDFDGAWSVSLTSTSGECQPNALPVDVSGGKVVSVAGMSGISTGGISPTGHVAIGLSGMGQSMSVTGAAKGVLASGTWRSDQPLCTGRWSAVRK